MSSTAIQPITIYLDDAPDIPGLSFRNFLGESDFPAMVEIINAANQEDEVEHVSTIEDVTRSYSHIQRSDTEKDLLFALIDGKPVGYGRCMWSKVIDGDKETYTYFFFVHLVPEWRGKGIGVAMSHFFIERIREIAAEHPAGVEKYITSDSSDTQVWKNQLMEKLGFVVERYGIEMTRPCSEPVEILALPEGIEVRPTRPEDLPIVFDAMVEAFRDHWNFVEPTEEDFKHFQTSPNFDPTLWKVAWEGDQVAGMVLNFINKDQNKNFNRQRGYTENISTRRPWRKRGIARALLTQSIRMFQEMGMEETALGVDTENPSGALKLYQDVGYREIKRFIFYRKPLDGKGEK